MTSPENEIRDLRVKREFRPKRFFLRQEMLLVYLFLAILAVLIVTVPELFFAPGTVQAIIRSGMDLSFMVLGMTAVLLLGEIDVSVGSIMIVSCTATGLLCQSGLPDAVAVLGGIAAGALCGTFNGVLVAKCGIPSVIVTIATSLLFRGIVTIALNGDTLTTYPAWFAALSWQDLGEVFPYSALCFLVAAAVLIVVLQKTRFGREVYLIGNSTTVSEYSGLRTGRVKIAVFTLMGVCSALSGILFAGRLGGISSGIGTGYELQVIAIVVLGGVSTNGGKGNAIGPVIATFIMAFLTKTLDLLWVHANVQKIIIGCILLAAVLFPALVSRVKAGKKRPANTAAKAKEAQQV